MRVKSAFTHDFGPGALNLTVDVPAGAPVDWHSANACWYVRPSCLPSYARHDAEYRGIRVEADNLEE
jgi:hypothetical protein